MAVKRRTQAKNKAKAKPEAKAPEKTKAENEAKEDKPEEVKEEKKENGKLTTLILDEPLRPGGPTRADVHESNLNGFYNAGWRRADGLNPDGSEPK